MTILLPLRFPISPGNSKFHPQTELSSRPERSVVERSAVPLIGSHRGSLALSCSSITARLHLVLLYVLWTQFAPHSWILRCQDGAVDHPQGLDRRGVILEAA